MDDPESSSHPGSETPQLNLSKPFELSLVASKRERELVPVHLLDPNEFLENAESIMPLRLVGYHTANPDNLPEQLQKFHALQTRPTSDWTTTDTMEVCDCAILDFWQAE